MKMYDSLCVELNTYLIITPDIHIAKNHLRLSNMIGYSKFDAIINFCTREVILNSLILPACLTKLMSPRLDFLLDIQNLEIC